MLSVPFLVLQLFLPLMTFIADAVLPDSGNVANFITSISLSWLFSRALRIKKPLPHRPHHLEKSSLYSSSSSFTETLSYILALIAHRNLIFPPYPHHSQKPNLASSSSSSSSLSATLIFPPHSHHSALTRPLQGTKSPDIYAYFFLSHYKCNSFWPLTFGKL